MPTQEFLDEFFPNPPNPEIEFPLFGINSDEIDFASIPDSPSKEEDMYNGLVSMRQSICYLSNQPNPSVTT